MEDWDCWGWGEGTHDYNHAAARGLHPHPPHLRSFAMFWYRFMRLLLWEHLCSTSSYHAWLLLTVSFILTNFAILSLSKSRLKIKTLACILVCLLAREDLKKLTRPCCLYMLLPCTFCRVRSSTAPPGGFHRLWSIYIVWRVWIRLAQM